MLFLGHLYAFVFINDHKKWAGIKRSTLLKWLPILLGCAGTLIWRAILPLILGVLLSIVWQITWRIVNRTGYVLFIPEKEFVPPSPSLTTLLVDQQLPVRATGVFSVKEREDRLFLRTAQLWRTGLGDHVMMVTAAPGRFRYEFINHSDLETVKPGQLLFGAKSLPSLAITFGSTWGPRYAEAENSYYVGRGTLPPPIKKTVYLTFDTEEAQQTVWQSLLIGR